VSRRHAVGGEGVEVTEGSRNIRLVAGECPERWIICAQIRAVCTDLLGPAENPDLLS
jgi:hypothetical protein